MQEVAEKAKEQKKQDGLLVFACARGYIADVDQLLDSGADARAVDKRRVSAIHYACVQGRLEVVQRLHRRGVELDVEDPGGRTPVHWAVLGGHARVVYLLSKGAWAEGYDSFDDTPLHLAARSGVTAIIKQLLGSGARSSVSDSNRRSLTPLGEALLQGHADAAHLLINQGKSSVAVRSQGLTLLHIAAAVDKPACMRLLLGLKSLSVDEGDNADGITPLHCAAMASSTACARMLLDAGADSSLTTHAGRLPCDMIPASAEPELQKLLQPSGKPHAQDAKHKQALGNATANGHANSSRSSAQAAFHALPEAQRQSRVQSWAEMRDDKLQGAVRGRWPAVLEHVQLLRMARQGLTIQQGTAELLEDEDFQRDSDGGRLDKVIDDIKAHPQTYERYAQDASTMAALAKLKRFHALVKASGQAQVPLDEVLRSRQPDWQAANGRRLNGLQRMAEAHTRAAIAAALADSEQQAASAASAIVDSYKTPAPPSSAPDPASSSKTAKGKAGTAKSAAGDAATQPATGKSKTAKPAAPAAPGPDATSARSQSNKEQSAEQARSATSNGSTSGTPAEREAAAQAQPSTSSPARLTRRSRTLSDGSRVQQPMGGNTSEIQAADGVDDLAAWEDSQAQEQRDKLQQTNARWGEVFTWQAFWKDLKRQMLQSGLVFVAAMFAMWAAGYPLPTPWGSSSGADDQQPTSVSLEDIYEKPLDLSGPLDRPPNG